MRMRWLFPILYFFLCEILDLMYESGLSHASGEGSGLLSALALVAITSPGINVGQLAHDAVSTHLGIAPNSIEYYSFWPRFLGTQAQIFFCTIVMVVVILFTVAIDKRGKQ